MPATAPAMRCEHLNLAGSADFGFPADPVRINEAGRTLWLKADVHF